MFLLFLPREHFQLPFAVSFYRQKKLTRTEEIGSISPSFGIWALVWQAPRHFVEGFGGWINPYAPWDWNIYQLKKTSTSPSALEVVASVQKWWFFRNDKPLLKSKKTPTYPERNIPQPLVYDSEILNHICSLGYLGYVPFGVCWNFLRNSFAIKINHSCR